MKNKKLFAILTLVCFMFTLMPVAAFAAVDPAKAVNVYVKEGANWTDDATVTGGTGASIDVRVGTTTGSAATITKNAGYVFYAIDDNGNGADVNVVSGDGSATAIPAETKLAIEAEGDYKVYAAYVKDATAIETLVNSIDTVANKVAKVKAWAESSNAVVAEYAVVTVTAPKYVYQIALTADNSTKAGYINTVIKSGVFGDTEFAMDIEASNGFNKDGGVIATLYRADAAAYNQAKEDSKKAENALTEFKKEPTNWTTVKNQKLTITKAGYVNVTCNELTTNSKGQVNFVVTSDLANTGNKVIVKFGNDAKATLTVNSTNNQVANVALEEAPKAPTNNENPIVAANVEFKFTDKNGVAVELEKDTNKVVTSKDVAITVVEKPAKSSLKDTDLVLVKQDVVNISNGVTADRVDGPGVYTLSTKTANAKFDKDGTYVIKVALKNGASATATVKVAEMGDVVRIMFKEAPTTVAYGKKVNVGSVIAMDANGVAMLVNEGVELSANGVAIDKFITAENTVLLPNSTAENPEYYGKGDLVARSDAKYIGQKITVMAVYDKEFVTTAELTVVDQAATIELISNEAKVGVNTVLEAKIVDASGAKTNIGAISDIKAIVLEKPANAVAVASTGTAPFSLNAKGNVEFNLLASAAGEYKVQLIVTSTDNTYVSGIVTVNVGGSVATFKDVVVLSIGSNNIIVNSGVKSIPAAPMVQDSRTFVPFRALAEAFGANVAWDEATQSVTAELNGVKVVMKIGEKAYTVNGVAKTADVAPFINGASTMVPVRFVAEAFGINVTPIYAENGGVADVMFAK